MIERGISQTRTAGAANLSLASVLPLCHTKIGSNPRKKNRNSSTMALYVFLACLINSLVTIVIYEGVMRRADDHQDRIPEYEMFLHKTTVARPPTGTILYEAPVHPKDTNRGSPAHPKERQQLSSRPPPPQDARVPTTFVPCPKEFRKLVYFWMGPSSKLYEPVFRAFHERGYSVTQNATRAHFLWTDQPEQAGDFFTSLQPWQRYNQIPNTREWDDKDTMALRMKEYYSWNPNIDALHSFPESYVLYRMDGLEAFERRLMEENGGLDEPWVLKEPTANQGKGVIVLPPRSDELQGIPDLVRAELFSPGSTTTTTKEEGRLVVQKYICDEMTYGGRKFDVRVFWAVVSVNPLVVLFHTEQNYVRIGQAIYDETKLTSNVTASNAKDHLTTHTFGASETKATWDEFRELVEQHVFGNNSEFRERFVPSQQEDDHDNNLHKTIQAIRLDPFGHVQNQMKTVIGHLVDAYQNITFHGRDMVPENGFSWHAADMIIDNNLDVYIIEGTDGPGKDEDYDFRIKMHSELLGSLVDVVEEVTKVQQEGLPLNVSAMKETGVLGGYEVVYNDGWFMDYRYQRLPQMGCLGNKSKKATSSGNSAVETPSALVLPTRMILPATFTALPNHLDRNPLSYSPKTFWMQSRTSRPYEPVARSLRRKGWTPVDSWEDAQLIYRTEQWEDVSTPKSWQWLSQFPSQFSFFPRESHHLRKYLGGRNVCQPIRHNDRPLEIMVYWLVLSLDPLIVLYHDGFLYFKYSAKDENEFLQLPKTDGTTERVWKGSWKALEHNLNVAHADLVSSTTREGAAASASPGTLDPLSYVRLQRKTASAFISLDPVSHVRNQMKASLATLAEGFGNHAVQQQPPQESNHFSVALFSAKFQVDRNLNTFLKDAEHSYVKGEDFAEVVSLHDNLYGSAFELLEYVNSTSFLTKIPSGTDGPDGILGKYEWLVRPNTNSTAPQSKTWKFQYNWKYKAGECYKH